MQIARLYIRGRMVIFTAANLTPAQKMDIEEIFGRLDNDPRIVPSKSKFKTNLAKTIGGEYKDPDYAENEWRIAAWRAILSATYHVPLEYRSFADESAIWRPKQDKKYNIIYDENGDATYRPRKMGRRGIIYDGDVLALTDKFSVYVNEELPIPARHILWICTGDETHTVTTNPRGLLSNPLPGSEFIVIRGEKVMGPFPFGPGSNRGRVEGSFGTLFKTFVKPGDIVKVVNGLDAGSEAIVSRATPNSLILQKPQTVIFGSNLKLMKAAYDKIMNDPYSSAQGEPQYLVYPELEPVHIIIRSRMTEPSAVHDDRQMVKLVKNYGWEYIGQILKENKRTMIKTTIDIKDNAERVALRLLESIFSNSKEALKFSVCNDTATIKTETGLMPKTIVEKVADLKREFLGYKVDISVIDDVGVVIKPNGETPIIAKRITEIRLNKMKSFDDKTNDEDKPIRYTLESQLADKEKLISHFETLFARDAIEALLDKLPDNAARFMAIMTSPPPDFFEQYGNNYREKDIAVYMGVNSAQIKRFKETIRLQMLALGMGPEDSLNTQT